MELSLDLIKPFVISAVSTWGVVQALKPLIKKYATSAWTTSIVRVFALTVGAAFGAALEFTATGALVGVCGAALSATVVKVVKRKVESGDNS